MMLKKECGKHYCFPLASVSIDVHMGMGASRQLDVHGGLGDAKFGAVENFSLNEKLAVGENGFSIE